MAGTEPDAALALPSRLAWFWIVTLARIPLALVGSAMVVGVLLPLLLPLPPPPPPWCNS